MKKGFVLAFTTICIQFSYAQTEKYFELTDTVFEKDMICIKDIQFTFDRPMYFPEFQPMIDSLAAFLRYYSNLNVEIGIHTDSRGSTEYNERLSQLRAQCVTDSLIARGVLKERLVPKGYGDTKPRYLEKDTKKYEDGYLFPKGTKLTEDYINGLNDKTDIGKRKYEDAHGLNRRMEIKILATDYSSSSNTKIYYNITHVPVADSLEMLKMD